MELTAKDFTAQLAAKGYTPVSTSTLITATNRTP